MRKELVTIFLNSFSLIMIIKKFFCSFFFVLKFKYISEMAGLCSYNFTVGFLSRYPDIMSDGQNKIKGTYGNHFDIFYGYKNERWDYNYESSFPTNLLIIK